MLGWIRENVLREEVITEALRELRRRLAERAQTADTEAPELEAQAKKLRAEIERLGDAIVSISEPPGALVRMMGEREKRLAGVEARLAAPRTAPAVLDLEVRRMEKEARRRVEEFADLVTQNPDEARSTQETLLAGLLRFEPVQEPEGKRFKIDGAIALETVFLTEGGEPDIAKRRSTCPTDGVPSGTRPEGHLGNAAEFRRQESH